MDMKLPFLPKKTIVDLWELFPQVKGIQHTFFRGEFQGVWAHLARYHATEAMISQQVIVQVKPPPTEKPLKMKD